MLIKLLAGPLAAVLVLLAPLPALSPEAHRLAAIMLWVVCYWVTEPIPLPLTALLGTAACVLTGLGPARTVFASYAHPIIFLLLGSFLLAEAVAVHRLDRRFAAWMLAFPWVGGRPDRILLALALVTGCISMWISNTAATALMLPTALGILSTLPLLSEPSFGRYRTGLLLLLSYAATAGGVATIIGTPANMVGVALIAQETGLVIPFLTWMAVGMPLAGVLLLSAWSLIVWRFSAETPLLAGADRHLADQRQALGPWTRGQVNACAAFAVALVLWVVPGLLIAALGRVHPLSGWLNRHLPAEVVAILAAGLLFLLPVNLKTGRFTLSWKQAAEISWGTVRLLGGGIARGDLMVKTGLAEAFGRGIVEWVGVTEVWSLTGMAILAAVLVSELASNTASVSMLVPVIIGIAQSAGVSPVPPALGACLGASLGFTLPVSTPPNALVYGTGMVPIRSMIGAGLLYDLVGAALIWLALRLLCPLAGLA
jgi:sodium-dependent dicarboxylate transporter 2/3/5